MSKIDLSEANVGDKFRTRDCQILEYVGKDLEHRYDKYKLIDKQGLIKHFYQYGEYLYDEEYDLDLIEQVFGDEKDTTDLEIVEAMDQAINENSKKAAERQQELQRRQEVVELAERLLFMNRMHDAYNDYIEALNNENLHTLISFPSYILQCAEDFIKYKNQYLKEGKL